MGEEEKGFSPPAVGTARYSWKRHIPSTACWGPWKPSFYFLIPGTSRSKTLRQTCRGKGLIQQQFPSWSETRNLSDRSWSHHQVAAGFDSSLDQHHWEPFITPPVTAGGQQNLNEREGIIPTKNCGCYCVPLPGLFQLTLLLLLLCVCKCVCSRVCVLVQVVRPQFRI